MPAGSKPGERRGGRKKGVPNKATMERQRLIEQAAAAGVPGAADVAKTPAGQKTSKQVLIDIMNYFLGQAALLQPKTPAEQPTQRFHEHLKSAAVIAKELLPYEHARVTQFTADPNQVPIKNDGTQVPLLPAPAARDITKMTDDELSAHYRETVAAGGQSRH